MEPELLVPFRPVNFHHTAVFAAQVYLLLHNYQKSSSKARWKDAKKKLKMLRDKDEGLETFLEGQEPLSAKSSGQRIGILVTSIQELDYLISKLTFVGKEVKSSFMARWRQDLTEKLAAKSDHNAALLSRLSTSNHTPGATPVGS
jgi:hypothetical protein